MNRIPPMLDMRADGSFAPRPRVGLPLSTKLLIGSALVGAVALSVAIAAIAVWVLSLLLPVLLGAALVGFATLKWRQWQARRGGGRVVRWF